MSVSKARAYRVVATGHGDWVALRADDPLICVFAASSEEAAREAEARLARASGDGSGR